MFFKELFWRWIIEKYRIFSDQSDLLLFVDSAEFPVVTQEIVEELSLSFFEVVSENCSLRLLWHLPVIAQ